MLKEKDTHENWQRHRRMIRFGHFIFGYRDCVFPLTFGVLLMTTRPTLLFGSSTLDWWMDECGAAIALSGQLVRALVIGVTDIKRGGDKKCIAAPRLYQDGLFAYSRNPLYLGNLLIVFGLILIVNSTWGYLLALPFFVGCYRAIVLAEEDFLHTKFGLEYSTYCRRVNRFLPHWTALRKSMRGLVIDWNQVLKREFGTAFTWVSMALVLLIWERWQLFGYAERQFEIGLLVSVFPFLWMSHGLLIWLKKTQRLGQPRATTEGVP